MMIKEAKITRPARLNGLHQPTIFIPPNSKDHLVEVDLGFTINPIYKQEKLCYFIPDQVYYQKLTLVDGKGNYIKDDARSMIISGAIAETAMITFEPDIYPRISAAAIGSEFIQLPFFPEINTELIIRRKERSNAFYHFSCAKIIYRTGAASYLQLRYLGNYYYPGMVGIIHKWHTEHADILDNIPEAL